MSGRLNYGPQEIVDPAARLNSPGLAVVDLTARGIVGSYMAFTEPADAREVAAACERAAELLEGRQIVPAT